MSTKEEQPSYWGILPANVRYANITPNAKLLYVELSVLTNKEGYAWANNAYFAKLYNVSKVSINNWLNDLKKEGFIHVETIQNEGNLRKIFLLPSKENFTTPSKENFTHNNTSKNTKKEYIVSKDTMGVNAEAVSKKNLPTEKTFEDGTPDHRNDDVEWLFEQWRDITGTSISGRIQANRRAAYNLIRKYDRTTLQSFLRGVRLTYDDKYAPRIASLEDLQSKMNELLAWGKRRSLSVNDNEIRRYT
jgi:hypothetical protein